MTRTTVSIPMSNTPLTDLPEMALMTEGPEALEYRGMIDAFDTR